MARMHLIQTWTDAAAYSGEQIQNRLSQSQTLHFNRDGSANTSAYADTPKEKPIDPLHWRLNPKQKALDLIDQQEAELEQAVMSGAISLDDYRSLVYSLLQRRETAYRAYLKSIGELDEYDKEMKAQYQKPVEKPEKLFVFKTRHVFFSLVLICIVAGISSRF